MSINSPSSLIFSFNFFEEIENKAEILKQAGVIKIDRSEDNSPKFICNLVKEEFFELASKLYSILPEPLLIIHVDGLETPLGWVIKENLNMRYVDINDMVDEFNHNYMIISSLYAKEANILILYNEQDLNEPKNKSGNLLKKIFKNITNILDIN